MSITIKTEFEQRYGENIIEQIVNYIQEFILIYSDSIDNNDDIDEYEITDFWN